MPVWKRGIEDLALQCLFSELPTVTKCDRPITNSKLCPCHLAVFLPVFCLRLSCFPVLKIPNQRIDQVFSQMFVQVARGLLIR